MCRCWPLSTSYKKFIHVRFRNATRGLAERVWKCYRISECTHPSGQGQCLSCPAAHRGAGGSQSPGPHTPRHNGTCKISELHLLGLLAAYTNFTSGHCCNLKRPVCRGAQYGSEGGICVIAQFRTTKSMHCASMLKVAACSASPAFEAGR